GKEYEQTCAAWPVHETVYSALAERVITYIRAGELDQAKATMDEGYRLSHTLTQMPGDAFHKIALELIDEGRKLAENLQIDAAVVKFKKALALDSSLVMTPTDEVTTIAVDRLIELSEELADDGRIMEAVASAQAANKLNPTLEIDPILEMIRLVEEQEIADEVAFCRYGAINGFAQDVLAICERGVETAKENGWAYDSRGIVRTLTGDTEGAIADFKQFVAWSQENDLYEEEGVLRESWIETLAAGENPFAHGVAEVMKNSVKSEE
ncbi:MAG: hypothetical protein AAF639_39770, partial [Chloroflexota bacterium]